MKLNKDDLAKIKKEYDSVGYRKMWSQEEDELVKQLIENGIVSPHFIKLKFFPDRTTRAIESKVSDMRRIINEKNK